MKPIVRIWPNSGSTGYYDQVGRMIAPPCCLFSSTVIAVRYWHETWEYVLNPSSYPDYVDRWVADGAALVADMNRYQSDVVFVYCVTYQNSHSDRLSYLHRSLPTL
jgi:hypothetical protein